MAPEQIQDFTSVLYNPAYANKSGSTSLWLSNMLEKFNINDTQLDHDQQNITTKDDIVKENDIGTPKQLINGTSINTPSVACNSENSSEVQKSINTDRWWESTDFRARRPTLANVLSDTARALDAGTITTEEYNHIVRVSTFAADCEDQSRARGQHTPWTDGIKGSHEGGWLSTSSDAVGSKNAERVSPIWPAVDICNIKFWHALFCRVTPPPQGSNHGGYGPGPSKERALTQLARHQAETIRVLRDQLLHPVGSEDCFGKGNAENATLRLRISELRSQLLGLSGLPEFTSGSTTTSPLENSDTKKKVIIDGDEYPAECVKSSRAGSALSLIDPSELESALAGEESKYIEKKDDITDQFFITNSKSCVNGNIIEEEIANKNIDNHANQHTNDAPSSSSRNHSNVIDKMNRTHRSRSLGGDIRPNSAQSSRLHSAVLKKVSALKERNRLQEEVERLEADLKRRKKEMANIVLQHRIRRSQTKRQLHKRHTTKRLGAPKNLAPGQILGVDAAWTSRVKAYNIHQDENGSKHAAYVIEVNQTEPAAHKWCVSRRFSEFVALQNKLVTANFPLLSKLPAKTFFRSFSKQFLTDRQLKLDVWARQLPPYFGRAQSDAHNGLEDGLSVALELHAHMFDFLTNGASVGGSDRHFHKSILRSAIKAPRPPRQPLVDNSNAI